MVIKVKNLAGKENPALYRHIQKQTGLTLPTIHRIIYQDLNKETRKKTRVHKTNTLHVTYPNMSSRWMKRSCKKFADFFFVQKY